MMTRESPNDGHLAEEGQPLVDEAAQRALRAAVRPALPNATAGAPIVVGFVSAGRTEPGSAAEAETFVGEPPHTEPVRYPFGEDAPLVLATASDPGAAAGVAFVQPTRIGAGAPTPTAALDPSRPAASPSSLVPVVDAAAAPNGPGSAAVEPAPLLVGDASAPPTLDASPRGEVPTPIADPPRLTVADAATVEDAPVPLTIDARIADLDGRGGESLSIVISGLPPGATLSAGVPSGAGTWRLAPHELDGLVLIPGQHWSGEVVLEVRAISSVGDGNDSVTSGEIALRVAAVADAPDATAADVAGNEDSAIALAGLTAGLVDQDGSETIAVSLLGVPADATLSAGTRQPDGSWSVTPAELAGLTLTPPLHFSGQISLSLVATATEPNGDTATTQRDFTLTVAAVADAPDATAADAAGNEDTAIALAGLTAGLVDQDGSETIAVSLLGVPADATLSAGTRQPDGSWALTPAALAGLTLTPPLHFSGQISLSLVATATEPNGDTATTQRDFTLTVAAVADAPTTTVADSTGNEDTAIALAGLTAGLVDQDGSETIAVSLLGVPADATLSAGTRQPDGSWTVTPADLAGLTLTPPLHFSGQISLSLVVTATEPNGDTATTQRDFTLTVAAVADAPTTTVTDSTGNEDTAIALAGLTAGLVDQDGSETIAVSLLGVPADATLSAGTRQPDGSWSVTPADLAALTLTPPLHFSGQISLSLVATATEPNGDTATTQRDFTLTVAAVADAPTTTVADAAGNEDTAIALAGLTAGLVDQDGSETIAVTLLGVPADATLSAGTRQPDGSWTVTPAELAGLTLTPPAHFAGEIALSLVATATEPNGDTATTQRDFTLTVAPVVDGGHLGAQANGTEDTWITIHTNLGASQDGSEQWAETVLISGVPDGAALSQGEALGGGTWRVSTTALAAGDIAILPPAHSDTDFALTLTATMIDAEGGLEARQDISAAVTVSVAAAADAPTITVADAAGQEDAWIALTGLSAALVDVDGSETLSVTIAGVPDGATLNAGTSLGGGAWSVPAGALATLSILPPENFAGEISLTLRAVATEAAGGSSEVQGAFTVTVAPVADQGSITVNGQGAEDGWITISARMATPDRDGSETWAETTTISGVPAGAVLSEGTEISPGVWEVATASLGAGQVMIRPPADSDADIRLTFETVLSDTANGTTSSRVIGGAGTMIVTAVADAPTVTVTDLAGAEDQPIPLTGLGGTLADTDGSETLSFRVSGLPAGGSLTAGTQNQDGSWTLTPAQLAAAAFVPPTNQSGTYTLTLTAIATESEAGVLPASASETFQVSVDPRADVGTITMSAAGAEDSWVTIKPVYATPDTDGSETWSSITTVTGVPAGAVLSQGTETAPGTWEVLTAELAAGNVAILPPDDSDADVTLTFQAVLTDTGNGTSDTRVITGQSTVAVTAVADAAAVTVADAAGDEDQWIALTGLSAALTDTDGSETLTVTIHGVPSGASLSHGTVSGGVWTVAAADLGALAIRPPRDFSGEIPLTLRAVTAEARDGQSATVEAEFTVTVAGVADTPSLRVVNAIGWEDSAITLTLVGTARDIDGSETITAYRVADVPAGAVLSTAAGPLTAEADGTYLVPAGAAGTLRITPPRDDDRDFTLRVSAISSEPNGSTAESPAVSLPVVVLAAADAAVGVTGGGTVAEDAPVPLNIAGALADMDGSEALSFIVEGVPAGMTLTHGTYAGPGRWSLTAEEAEHAALVVPRDWAGEVPLTLTAVTQEGQGGSSATIEVPITVTVGAVIDTPDVGGLGGTAARWDTARGNEDSAIALNLDPGLNDRDGSESVVGSITISGVPAGATLRYDDGTVLSPGAGGAYSIPAERMGDVEIIPPANSDVAFELSVSMTIEDTGGVRETISGAMTVDPKGVADVPLVTAGDVSASGHASSSASDGWIPLTLSAASADADGSETVQLVLHDVPDGFVLSAGRNMGGGTWVLGPGEEAGLSIRPPSGFTGDVALRVEGIATEREGDTETVTTGFTLTVAAPATGGGGGDGGGGGGGGGGGDGSTPPPDGGGGSTPPPGDPAGASVSVTAALADGAEDGALALTISGSATGGSSPVTLTYVVSDLPTGTRLSAGFHDAASDRWLVSAAELDGLLLIPPADFSGAIDITVTAVATDAIGKVSTASTAPEATITAIADAPEVNASPATGAEDQAVALNISASLEDRDGSETLTAVIISDVPAGATLTGPGITDNGDGTFSVDPAHLGSLAIIPPANAHGDYAVTVTVRAAEASNGDSSETVRSVAFSVEAVADAPILSASAASGLEDTAIPLTISAALADTDGSEMLSIVISGLPVGAILSAGINNGDGSWTFAPGQLAGLTMTPPLNHSGTINATVTAFAKERSNGSVTETSVPLTINEIAVADTPIVDAPSSRTGDEDTAITVNLRAWLTDTDGSETLSVTATNVPPGSVFNKGTENPDGSWTFAAAELTGLTYTAPPHVSGDITVRFTVTATESNGDTNSVPADITFTVRPVTDAVAITVAPAEALEGQPVPLAISVALIDADGSEEIVGITIAGLPDGATLSAGTAQPDGSWLLTAGQLAGLTLNPAPGWAGQVNLTVTAETRELESGARMTTTVVPVTVDAVASSPTLTASAAPGTEDGQVALSIATALTDTDGSEELTGITISGLPPGATLSAGTAQLDGSWLLSPGQLAGLKLIPAPNWSGNVSLSVTSEAREIGTDERATTTRAVPVTIAAVADAPTLAAGNVSGEEGTAIPLTISAALVDTDGSETLGALIVSGLPDGFSLSAGTGLGGGAWSVPAAAIGGLAVITPAGWTGDVVLGLSITATESTGASATTTGQLTVTVEDQLTPPVIDLVIATPVAAGATGADLIGAVTATDPDGDAIVSATITLGAGRDASDRIVVTGHTLTADGDDLVIGDTGIRVVGGGLDAATGVLSLSGSASAATYAEVLDSLSLVNAGGGALAIGTRSVSVTLTDATGEAATDATSLIVSSSVIVGDGTDRTLQGSNAADVIVGSSGNETLRGLAGNDLFLIESGGGDDIVQGGGGFDTLMLKGVTGGPVAGPPAVGDWTLVLDAPDPGMVQGDGSLVFSEATSGRVVFGDGSQVEFSQLERISW